MAKGGPLFFAESLATTLGARCKILLAFLNMSFLKMNGIQFALSPLCKAARLCASLPLGTDSAVAP